MNRNPLTLIIGILLIIIFGLLLFTFQVRQSEVVIVTRFGKLNREIKTPGPRLRWPWGIEMVHRFDQRVQNFEDKLTEGLTRDSFNLLTSVYVGWKITQPRAFFPKFAGTANPSHEAEEVLERVLGNAKSAVVGKHALSDFVSATDNGTNFLAIEKEILDAVQAEVRAHNYGLDIEFLGLRKLELPETVTQSVFERMTSERKVLADKSQFEGEAEAQKIRSEAERKAAEMVSNAEAQATTIRGKAEAEAAKSLAVFQQNPELANFIFGLDALVGSLKERSILIFDQRTPPFNILAGGWTNLANQKSKDIRVTDTSKVDE
jgi:membrane protease subunit HflC